MPSWPPMHPGGRRCSSLSYTRYARSSRLARRRLDTQRWRTYFLTNPNERRDVPCVVRAPDHDGRSVAGRAPERQLRHQLGAPFTVILTAVTLFTGPVMNRVLSFRPAKVLLVAPPVIGICRMLLPLGSKAITPVPLLI